MSTSSIPPEQWRPDPWARAPRVTREGNAAHARLHLAPASLQGALLCVIQRDTRGIQLSDVQRLSHLPATPFVCLTVLQDFDADLIEPAAPDARWKPFGARAMISGSQSQPTMTWAPGDGRAVLALFTVEVAQTLFGIKPAELHDRFVPAHLVLDRHWWPLLTALQLAADDAATLEALERFIAARWKMLQADGDQMTSMRRIGRHWLEKLAWQASLWGRTCSPRQVERRIKSLSGRSLREWNALLKAEGVLFSARDRYEAGQPLNWTDLALDEGFADQAHLVRAVKRVTGFTPTAFVQRYLDDESFWLYRLWV